MRSSCPSCESCWVRLWSVLTKNRLWFAQFPSHYPTADDILRANQFHAHKCNNLLTCSDDDNQWFWVDHLRPMWVMLGQICGQGSTKIGCDLPNFRANILLYDILRANQFHAHIHAIIFWHAQMMISIVIGCDLPNFRAIILPDDIHRANKFHADHL
jgi:hypothetical protein